MTDVAYAAAIPSRPIRVTQTGDQVQEAQTLLREYFRGTPLKVDSQNGSGTSRLLARFQRAEGLESTPGVALGQVDDTTLERLRAGVQNGGYLGLIANRTNQIISDVEGPRTGPTTNDIARFQPRPPTPGEVARATPQNADVQRYTVQAGDKIDHIASAHGVTPQELLRYNPGLNPNQLTERDMLLLPPNARRPERPLAFDPNTQREPQAWTDPPAEADRRTLERGRVGAPHDPVIESVQRRLQALGYRIGDIDGKFGPDMQGAVRAFQGRNGDRPTGVVNDATWSRLLDPNARPAGAVATGRRFEPGSPEMIALFRDAGVQHLGMTAAEADRFARSPGLANILRRESDGQVGRPNYTYGARARNPARWESVLDELRSGSKRARSSASGLGQLLLANVDLYYPSGRAGIGNPMEEAAGMMAYIRARYRTPERAWALYGKLHEGY